MVNLLGRSGLDEELLAWVWEHSSSGGISFVTIGPTVNEDRHFSREQGIAALYLAQNQAELELDAFMQVMSLTDIGDPVALTGLSVARLADIQKQPGLEVYYHESRSEQLPSRVIHPGISQAESSTLEHDTRPIISHTDLEVHHLEPRTEQLPSKVIRPRISQAEFNTLEHNTRPTINQPGQEVLAASLTRLTLKSNPVETSVSSINHSSSTAKNFAVEMISTPTGSTTKEQGISILDKYREEERLQRGKWGFFKQISTKYSQVVLGTALQEAAMLGSLPLVEFFISQGSDVNYDYCQAKNGKTCGLEVVKVLALILAIEQGHVHIVTYLVTQCALQQSQLNHGLISAVAHARIRIVKMLLAKGADVNYQERYQGRKQNALGLAIESERSFKTRKALLDCLYKTKCLNVNSKSLDKPPLLVALSMKRYEEANWLIRAGVDVRRVGADGRGPLHAACGLSDPAWAQRLLKLGASISCRTSDGVTPLMCASAKGNLPTMKLLLARGADIHDGSVVQVSKFGHLECLRYMVEHGANMNEGSLHVAARYGQWEVVQLHLDVNADLDACAREATRNQRCPDMRLSEKRHSIISHLVRAPNRNATYRSVMQALIPIVGTLDPHLLSYAVKHYDEDLVKWILQNFPAERGRARTTICDNEWHTSHSSLLQYIDCIMRGKGAVGKASLLAIKSSLLYYEVK